jgi:hypothetical protein
MRCKNYFETIMALGDVWMSYNLLLVAVNRIFGKNFAVLSHLSIPFIGIFALHLRRRYFQLAIQGGYEKPRKQAILEMPLAPFSWI